METGSDGTEWSIKAINDVESIGKGCGYAPSHCTRSNSNTVRIARSSPLRCHQTERVLNRDHRLGIIDVDVGDIDSNVIRTPTCPFQRHSALYLSMSRYSECGSIEGREESEFVNLLTINEGVIRFGAEIDHELQSDVVMCSTTSMILLDNRGLIPFHVTD